MSRANIQGYVTPYKSDGTAAAPGDGRGKFVLEAGTTYYFQLGGADATVIGAHLSWPSSSLIITSAKIEDANIPAPELLDYDTYVGGWMDEDPTTAFVAVVGTNVTQTNGVVAATGDAGGGGCFFHIADTGARRTRIALVVGATGGQIRCAVHGKD